MGMNHDAELVIVVALLIHNQTTCTASHSPAVGRGTFLVVTWIVNAIVLGNDSLILLVGIDHGEQYYIKGWKYQHHYQRHRQLKPIF